MRYVLLVLLLLGTLAIVERGEIPCEALQSQPACYVTMRPGPTRDVLDLTQIDGEAAAEGTGELLLTTVSIQDGLGWRDFLRNTFDDQVRNLDRELIYPSDVTRDDVTQQNAAAMDSSETDATIAGLQAAGYDLSDSFEGAEVQEVTVDGAVTNDEVRIGDVIIAVNGQPVTTSSVAVDFVRQTSPGDQIVLTIVRGTTEIEVPLVTAPNPQDASLPYLGLLLSTKIVFPVDVSIDAGTIGGPSAGMMFALGIVDLLTDEDLTGGRVIAGTGTITTEGLVGPIGGIQQKIVGATSRDNPAELFLVPRANFVEAKGAAVDRDVTIVPIDNLADSLAVLRAYAAGESIAESVALGP